MLQLMKTYFAVKVLSITAVQASANDLKYGIKYRNLALQMTYII